MMIETWHCLDAWRIALAGAVLFAIGVALGWLACGAANAVAFPDLDQLDERDFAPRERERKP